MLIVVEMLKLVIQMQNYAAVPRGFHMGSIEINVYLAIAATGVILYCFLCLLEWFLVAQVTWLRLFTFEFWMLVLLIPSLFVSYLYWRVDDAWLQLYEMISGAGWQ